MIDRTELLARKITDIESAQQWIRDLHSLDLLFHFEDSPETIVSTKTDARTFSDAEAQQIKQRIDELYALAWGEHECPIGYALDLTEPGWRTK